MEVRISKEKLLIATQTVSNVVATKTPLPILNNVLIESISKQKIRLSATDLDVSISIVIPAEVKTEGTTTVPAKKFNDIIRTLAENEPINLMVRKNNNIVIESGPYSAKLIGLSKEDFPRIPSLEKTEQVKIEQAVFLQMLNLTAFSVSYDDTRPTLKGVLLIINNDSLTLVATDGRRLAKIKNQLLSKSTMEHKVVVPTKAIQELSRSLSDEGEITLCFDKNQIGFCFEDTIIISRLIEGSFPDYEQVIPQKAKTIINLDKDKFLSAIKRAGLLTTQMSQKVRLDLFKGKIVVQGSSAEVGESKEDIDITQQDQEMATAFNPIYLEDALRNISTREVLLELTESQKPAVIKVKGMDYIYVIMPMNLD